MRSVIVRLKGGAGNQLFQYATARAIAIRNDLTLKLDALSGFRGDPYARTFILKHFNICGELASPYECFMTIGGRARRYLTRELSKLTDLKDRFYIAEGRHSFNPKILELRCPRGVYLEGYWQSELYFRDVQEQIRKELRFIVEHDVLNKQLAERIQAVNSVAVHYRRYRALPGRPADLVRDTYYKESLRRIREAVPNAVFIIFSDAPEWAQEHVKIGGECVFVSNNLGEEKSCEDLWLMSLCRHHILANSTFGWWGAWLRADQQGTVIAPEEIKFNCDIVPKDWLVL